MVDVEKNRLKKTREDRLLSRLELANIAGVSPLTIARIEEGSPSRIETKRRILSALGLDMKRRKEVWPDIP